MRLSLYLPVIFIAICSLAIRSIPCVRITIFMLHIIHNEWAMYNVRCTHNEFSHVPNAFSKIGFPYCVKLGLYLFTHRWSNISLGTKLKFSIGFFFSFVYICWFRAKDKFKRVEMKFDRVQMSGRVKCVRTWAYEITKFFVKTWNECEQSSERLDDYNAMPFFPVHYFSFQILLARSSSVVNSNKHYSSFFKRNDLRALIFFTYQVPFHSCPKLIGTKRKKKPMLKWNETFYVSIFIFLIRSFSSWFYSRQILLWIER